MKRIVTAFACMAVLAIGPVSADDQDSAQQKNQNARQQQQQGEQRQQQGQQQQQTIHGTIAGVTVVGEAVIDPQSNQAVIVEVDYLTILGMPLGEAGGGAAEQSIRERSNQDQSQQERPEQERSQQRRSQQQAEQSDQNRQRQSAQGQADTLRQNLYLVAITPETKIRMAGQNRQRQGQSAQDRQSQQDEPSQQEQQQQRRDNADRSDSQRQAQSQTALQNLEIGDRVIVEFSDTQRLHASAEEGEKSERRSAAYRGGDQSKKFGRNRIYVGQAQELTVMSDGGQQQQRGRTSERQQRDRQNQQEERQQQEENQ